MEDVDNIIFPDSGVSFINHVQPLLTVKCAISYCHSDESRAGGYSLTAWNDVTNPQLIVRGVPESSLLYLAISDPTRHQPFIYPLNDNQIKGIRTWIKEGAEYN